MSVTKDSIPFNECSSLTSSSKPLGKNDSESFISKIKEWRKKICKKLYPTGFIAELKSLLLLAFPLLIVESSLLCLSLTPLFFCGHLETTVELDVAALAISIFSATVVIMGFGISNACTTYTSQAFASGAKEKIGLFVQTAIYVTTLSILPVLALHENIASFLYVLGQDPIISKLVGDYMFVMIPGTISYYFFQVLDKYMIGQRIVLPSMLSVTISAMLNIVFHYVLINWFYMGLLGSSISMSLSFIFMLAFMFFYIRIRNLHKDSWTGFRMESLQYFASYSKLAFTSMFQICSEAWIFDIGIFLAGYLSQEELGALSISYNMDSVWCQVPVAICVAVLTMTSQYISVSNIDGIKTIYRVALTVIILLSTIHCIILIVWRKGLSELFTDKREVSDEASILLIIIGIYSIFDGLCSVLLGLLMGLGRYWSTFKTTLIGYYVISLPLGVSLMFTTPLRLSGFYIGIAVGSASKLIFLCIVVFRIDWQQEIENAMKRISGTEKDTEETESSKIISTNQSNEPPSDQTSTVETLCIEENTKTSPSCSQQLFRIIFAGDNSSTAFFIGLPVATIVIFIAGIVCSLTIELPFMSTGMFVFNSSAIHHSL